MTTRYALTDIIEELVGQPISERGENVMLRCPLPTHPERHASFSINLDKGLWLCHSCGEKGGLEKLARLMEQEVDADDIAVRRALELAQTTGFEEPRDFWEMTVRWELAPEDKVDPAVKAFCKSRAISRAALHAFRIGWDAERRRIVFPYWDDNRVVAVKYRYVDNADPKHNKGSESGSRASIFGIDAVRMKPVVLLCEGESDTLAAWSAINALGLSDKVGVGGVPGANAFSADRWELSALDLLWAETVLVAFDGDAAGDKGAAIALRAIGDKATRARPPEGYDLANHLLEGGTLDGLAGSDVLVQLAA